MAVSGSLQDIPIFDLFGLFAQNTGVLRLSDEHTRCRFDLHVHYGCLTSFQLEDRKITNLVRIQTYLVASALFRNGTFRFEVGTLEQLDRDLNVPLSHLALEVARLSDEIQHAEYSKIPANRVVRLSATAEVKIDNQEDYAFADFFRQAEDLVITGISPEELARTLRISVLQSQYYLVRLADMGVLEGAVVGADVDPIHPRTSYPLKVIKAQAKEPSPPSQPVKKEVPLPVSPASVKPLRAKPILSTSPSEGWMAKQTTRITNVILNLLNKKN